MLTTVITINLLIALLCLYAAWRVWQLRRVLARVADTLNYAERCTHATLQDAPGAIIRGRSGTHQLRRQYQQLEQQLQAVRQVLALLSLGQVIWLQLGRGLAARRVGRQP